MTRPFYQQLNWAHYHRDTYHLKTAAQHGAYLLLIGAVFEAGGRMKADDATLAGRACCTPEEWAALKPTILAFFKLSRGWLSHKRVSADLANVFDERGKRSEAGKAGGLASGKKRRELKALREARASQNEAGASKIEAKRTYTESQSYTPEDKSSGAELTKEAWGKAAEILIRQGGMKEPEAKRFFGGLLARNSLQAAELLPSLQSAILNATGDPKAYLARAAELVAKRKGGAGVKAPDLGFV